MAQDAPAAGPSGKLVIRNVGLMLSGDLHAPILDADTIVCLDGRIAGIGRAKDLDLDGARTTIDAHGSGVAPGLIDSHVHPVAGDWTPRQSQLNWIDSTLHGGVTTMISAGEVHMPGRPRDIVGLKAMAIFAQRAFTAFRPGGMKIHAGAPVIEPGMVEEDFKDLAAAGVTLLGEVGLGGVKDGPTARRMVAWARQYGIQSTIHTGGPSIPGSGLIDSAVVLEADTDVVGHINGGHTALPDREIRCICEGCRRGLEIVHNGNERAALYTLRTAREMDQVERVILGTDGPAGSGVQPLGILRMISMLSSLGEVPAEIAFCFGTGNTARMRALDCGLIEVGRAADFVFLDRPQHGAGRTLLEAVELGDLPGVGMVVIDGIVRTGRSRNTRPPSACRRSSAQADAAALTSTPRRLQRPGAQWTVCLVDDVILIDNYDSFTWNLFHDLGALGADVKVVRNDAITVEEVVARKPGAIVLSPGPGTPSSAGVCLDLLRHAGGHIPVLGVCLGHQAIGEAYGAIVGRAPVPMHGKVSTIRHEGRAIFRGLNGPFRATRYHSLIVEEASLSADLLVTARSEDGAVMGLSHVSHPVHGVQFHPESIASEQGRTILKTFLTLAEDFRAGHA